MTNPVFPEEMGGSLFAVDADETASAVADVLERSPQAHDSETGDLAAPTGDGDDDVRSPIQQVDSAPEPNAEARSLLVRAVRELRERGRKPTSAGVKSEMKALSRGFDETKIGFDSFRAFLTAVEREDLISLRPAPSGPDVLVMLSDERPSYEQESPRVVPSPRRRIRPDLWKAFIDWDPKLLRAIERDTHEIVCVSREPTAFEPDSVAASRDQVIAAPERFIAIEPISQQQQLEWMAQFVRAIEEGHTEKDLLLNALKGDKPAAVFARTIRPILSLNQAWYGQLVEHVSEVISDWLAQHDIRLDIFDGARSATESARRVRGRAPQSARQGTRMDEFRGEILAMLAQLPTEELMQIRVPALYLLKR